MPTPLRTAAPDCEGAEPAKRSSRSGIDECVVPFVSASAFCGVLSVFGVNDIFRVSVDEYQ